MINFKQIYEGWRNKLVPPSELKDLIEKTSEERMEICKKCYFFSTNAKEHGYKTMRPDEHCSNCGCTLSAKTKCLSCKCPLERWMEIATDEEEQKIKKAIADGQQESSEA